MVMHRRRPPRVGLVLGGGAARGWAHIGAIRALEEAGIKPDVVCGTSIGALVGAVYANGDLDWLEDWVGKLTWQTVVRLLDLRFSGGLLGGRKVIDLFAQQFNGRAIDDLKMPFTAVATELDTGREVWLREGGVVDAVRASIAIPGIFTPIWHDGVWLVDGGLSNPVPVSAARAMRADTVIAIDLNHDILNGRDLGGAIDTVKRETPVEPPRAGAAVVNPADPAAADVAGSAAAEPAPLLRRNGKRFPSWLQPSAQAALGSPDVRSAAAQHTRAVTAQLDRAEHRHHAGAHHAQPPGGRAGRRADPAAPGRHGDLRLSSRGTGDRGRTRGRAVHAAGDPGAARAGVSARG
jgi:NTE family protein